MERFVRALPPELQDPAAPAPPGRIARLLGRVGSASALGLVAVAWVAMTLVPTRALEHAAAQRAAALAFDGLGLGGSALLSEVWATVADAFYDPNLHGLNASDIVAEFSHAADDAASQAELRDVVNASLARLNASHTRLFTPDENAYYEVLDVFNPNGLQQGQIAGQPRGPVSYVGIGCVTRTIDGRDFVTDVYPTGPADQAGLRVGDQIVSAAGQAWGPVEPFAGRAGEATPLIVRRAQNAPALELTVTPESIRPRAMYLKALDASAREINRDGCRLAYVRLRSYAHQSYQDALIRLMDDRFADADGLIIDLRGGWGGASPHYTDAFNPAHPHMQMRGRGGSWNDVSRVWDKPLVILIDEGTRSGKEMIADSLQRAGVATLVGTPSAGAVLGGTTYPMSDGSLLMVAVTDVRIDGSSLENNPVRPDVLVERPIPWCNGADPQMEAGIGTLVELVQGAKPL